MKHILRILMALLAITFVGCNEPEYGTTPDTTIGSLGTPDDNEIWFTTTDDRVLLSLHENAFDVAIEEVVYIEGGVNIIRFAEAVTSVDAEAFRDCANIFNLSLPNSVTKIGDRAFFDCKNMECITLGSGLRNCGIEAFEGCYNLRSLHIPSIAMWFRIAFASKKSNPLYFTENFIINGEKIRELNTPDGVETIHDYAFIYNTYLESVNISRSVKSIGQDAFEGCENIKKVNTESVKSWCGIDFKSELSNPLSIAMTLYENGAVVSRIDLTNTSHIYSYTFINCTSLKSLSSDNTLEEIGVDAFRNCSALQSVSLGNKLIAIGKQAFWNCEALDKVVCQATTPPMLGNSSTFGRNAEGRKIYVPAASVDTYKSSWSTYADDIYAIE